MEVLKFWRYISAGADAASEVDAGEDSFFDLVFTSPDRNADHRLDGVSNKDFHLIESPRDVLRSNNDFSNSKPSSPVTILRSAPKFKVFMLGFKKSSKCEKTESNGDLKATPLPQFSKLGQSNRFSVKCRVSDMPSAPAFGRDNSLRSKMLKESCEFETSSDVVSSQKSVPRYLKLMKPFTVKASNRAKSTDSFTPSSSPVTAPVNFSPRKFSEGSRAGSFKIGARNLGKSRTGSTLARVAPPSVRRRDDSLLEQSDGIQGAILHCKKSYSSSSQEYSPLFRTATDPSHEKCRTPWRNSFEEPKRCSI